MKIAKVVGREIFDSRGFPTISCEMQLDDGTFVYASVPSGTSKSSLEAFELRDHEARLNGMGVTKAIHNLEHIIAPILLGKEPDVAQLDPEIRELDSSPDKRIIGANAMLAASIAVCKAQAAAQELPLFELIAQLYGAQSVSLPFPLLNVLNGGAHGNNKFPIQEIMLVPIGAHNFRDALEQAVTIFHELQKLLNKAGKLTAVGDEGGFAPRFETDTEPFMFLQEAINNTGNESSCTMAIDVAATQLYDPLTHTYKWNGTQKSSAELIEFYQQLVDQYHLFSIEDGLAESDRDGWKQLFTQLGGQIQIVGDDIFATNAQLIIKGIEDEIANAALIKPNQIGTLTETFEAIAVCQQAGMNAIISHRSGETNDSFIADLAVGVSAGQIKAGGCSRGERLAKYNRLLIIEDMLTMDIFDF